MPLGIRHHARFQARTLAILPGDALFVCSDGVFEAVNDKGDLFSIERLSQLLREANAAEPREMVRVIKDAVDAFTGIRAENGRCDGAGVAVAARRRDRRASDRVAGA